MKIYHGHRLYAVDRGGRGTRPTIKIYDGSNAFEPRATISGAMIKIVRTQLRGLSREAVEQYLRSLLPSTDPYHAVMIASAVGLGTDVPH
jgi:hypothetical protein